jgi:hypothetical protein
MSSIDSEKSKRQVNKLTFHAVIYFLAETIRERNTTRSWTKLKPVTILTADLDIVQLLRKHATKVAQKSELKKLTFRTSPSNPEQ